MRCYSCDCELNDSESTRKSVVTGDYLDLCDSCMSETEITYIETPTHEENEDSDE